MSLPSYFFNFIIGVPGITSEVKTGADSPHAVHNEQICITADAAI